MAQFQVNLNENLQVDDQIDAKLIAELENEKYDWRTLVGLMRDTGLTLGALREKLLSLGRRGIVVQATDPRTGEEVFTTREYYNKKRSLWDKLLTGLTGSIQF